MENKDQVLNKDYKEVKCNNKIMEKRMNELELEYKNKFRIYSIKIQM